MAIETGTKLGPYEILAPIGAGGMGEVYKARDTRLDRSVAIKVLPPHWADNSEMKQRFEREAQTIASLNHPHICVLHDIGQQDGIDFLVMEFLEGETLTQRIERGALSVDEALKVAIAIADALDKAHGKGVIHRDLKPGNVMLTETGPKLLDFGLAKLSRGLTPKSGSGPSVTSLPTRADVTMPGTILGTLQYMAPEQLEGSEADARTDIFSFGVLLYEMVTGKKAFEGKSQILLISAIAATEPQALTSIQPSTPPALEHVVKTCLAKDPKDRWQTARDLLAELQWIQWGGSAVNLTAPITRGTGKRERLLRILFAAAAVLLLAVAVPAALYLRGPKATGEFRFRVPVAPLRLSGNNNPDGAAGTADFFAISPDGHSICFRARVLEESTYSLYVGPIGSVTFQRLAGTEDARQPFWSADSRSIAFVMGGKLKKVEASGGPPQDICEAPDFSGGTWNSEGTTLYGSARGLYRVSHEGGKPALLTTLGPGETGHLWPRFLPDGRHYLYLSWSGQASSRAVFAGNLDSKERVRVMAAESNAAYADPGYLLFRRENTVYAQSFDAKKLALTREPVRVADEVTYNAANGRGSFDVSHNGVLVYNIGSNVAGLGAQVDTFEWQVAWAGRTGQVIETPGTPGVYRGVELSPDGKRIAVHRHEGAGGDIWVIEPRGNVTRLTLDASHDNSTPIWSPDGSRIVYGSRRNDKWGLYQTVSDGSGSEELLFESELLKAPMSWAPDGKRIVFWVQDPKTAGDLWVLPLDGDKKPVPLIASTFDETHGQVSPDGKWIAYTSNSSGRKEIYVKPFPAGSGGWQISTNGGDWPRWRKDGKEIFYHSYLGTGPNPTLPILAAPVNAKGSTFEPGSPRDIIRIFAINLPHSGGDYHTYDVSPDGQRFLTFQFVIPTNASSLGQTGPDATSGLIVALNWASSLKK